MEDEEPIEATDELDYERQVIERRVRARAKELEKFEPSHAFPGMSATIAQSYFGDPFSPFSIGTRPAYLVEIAAKEIVPEGWEWRVFENVNNYSVGFALIRYTPEHLR
jgi:hypothetical protein